MLLREPALIEPVGAARPSASRAPFLTAGNPRPVLYAARDSDADAVLALVLETEGSTYAHAGAMAYFDARRQVGWLSGGCLEPALAQEAAQVAAAGVLAWLEIDTRGDEDLLSGSALGCRGRLRLALLPLQTLVGLGRVIDAWLDRGEDIDFALGATGEVRISAGAASVRTRLPTQTMPWPTPCSSWSWSLPRLPSALLLGAGPESLSLLRLLHDLGWRTTLVERRPRWRNPDAPVDRRVEETPATLIDSAGADVALVMHHHFELDREALEVLAHTPIPFIGLLGPQRRRDDLFKLLTPEQRASIAPRLRSPVGMPLGGQGPEAIALSIAAQLQAWRASFAPQ
jgi:xanthine dehydrogenase accessory factor